MQFIANKPRYIRVKVTPNATKSEFIETIIDSDSQETQRFRLAAPADKGKANEELIKVLSKILALPKSQIDIISGHTSRTKLIKIQWT